MRLPVIPTLLVGAAVATMIGLGVWQLDRSAEKKALVAQYERASQLPPIAFPAIPPGDNSVLYRRATGTCLEPVAWRTIAGRNAAGETGWSHIAGCRTGAEGPGMQVDIGWSARPAAPRTWRGGFVDGIVAPDREHRIRLVSATAAPGLVPSGPPSPRQLSDNHLLYAGQWFFFALAAAVIYALALRKRLSD